MQLITQRLILRDFKESDVDALALILGDKEVMRFSLAGALSKEQTREYLQSRILDHYAQHGFGLYAVIEKATDQLIGLVGLIFQVVDNEELVELGYRIAPKYWGKGLASEAVSAVCHYAFDQLNFNRLISIIDPKNTRSIQVAKRLGMYLWKESVFHNIPVGIYAINKLALESYQASWEEAFHEEREKLKNAFSGLEIEFHHIGSTSIPGCSAKPIIDLLGITSDVTRVDAYNHIVSTLGYEPMGEYGMKQRRFFRRKSHIPVNLHIFEDTDPEVERHFRFRNYLRTHPEKVQEYSQLKETLAKKFPGNVAEYSLEKDQFIKSVDIAAAHEAKHLLNPLQVKDRKRHWTSEEVLKAMEVNFHLQMTWFAKHIPSLKLLFQQDVKIVQSEQNSNSAFNYALSAQFTHSNLKRRVEEVFSLFETAPVPFYWWVGDFDTPQELGSALISHGLIPQKEYSGMYLELDRFVLTVSQTPLIFQQAFSFSQLTDFIHVIDTVKKNAGKLFSMVPSILYQKGGNIELYVGYLNHVPICAGMLLFHANAGGIYCLATVPDHQNKGHGTAMVEYLLQQIKEQGFHLALLQALKEDVQFYTRCGFINCCTIKAYTKPI